MDTPTRDTPPPDAPPEPHAPVPPLHPRFLHYFAYVAFGLSGASALVYEVVYTRKLSTIMGSSTYALSTMLGAFMTGLSLGGAVGALLVPRLRRHLQAFALCEIAIGLSALAAMPLIEASMPLFLKLYFAFHASFRVFSVAQFVVVFGVLLVPTTLMGMTFPLVIRHFADGRGDIGRRAGFLYSVNTLGAVVGSMAAGFALLPAVGASDATLCAALLNFAGGAVILSLSMSGQGRLALTSAILAVAAILRVMDTPFVPFVSSYSAHRFGSYEMVAGIQESIRQVGWHNVVVFHHEGLESDVYVMREAPEGELVLSSNGKLEGGAGSTGFVLLADLPYFSRPRHTGAGVEVLNIGLGSGITLARLAELPGTRTDSVELSEGVVEANRRFLRPALFGQPRIRHVVADGRNYLLLQQERRYDVIVVSPSWAVELASGGLLTDEFFALAARRLVPGGVVAIWLDLFYAPDEDVDIVVRTFRRSFPHATAWVARDGGMVLVGSAEPFAISEPEIRDRVIQHAPELAGAFRVARSRSDWEGLHVGRINTDDHPIIEFRNARNLITGLTPPERPAATGPDRTPETRTGAGG